MSTLKVNKLRDTAGSTDAITFDPNGGAVLAGVTTVSTIKVGSGVTISSDGDVFTTGITTSSDYAYSSHPGVASFTGDNSTTTMTIASGHSVNSVLVVYNGVVLTPTTDYTISGTTLTFTFTPVTSSQVVVRYLIK